MKTISLEEQKNILLDILIDFDRVCRANAIDYSIAYGTLLGADRHHGFIPWDDDIDVIVTREEYNKIKKVMNEGLKENYYFVSAETDKRFAAPLAKIIDTDTVLRELGHYSDKLDLGVYIDIFVCDFVPDDIEKRQKVYKKSVFFQNLWSFAGNNFENGNKLVNAMRSMANKTPIARYASLYSYRWAEKASGDRNIMAPLVFGNLNRDKNLMEFKDLMDLTEYEFEGHNFRGIRDYDKYLKIWYGNYMELPPEEKRVSDHPTEVYWKE